MIPDAQTPDRSTYRTRLFMSLVGIVAMGAMAWGPMSALLHRAPATLPDRIRAVEGDVWIEGTWRKGDDGAYELKMTDGRSLTLYCGPFPQTGRCLELPLRRVGYTLNQTFRLTIAYGAEVLADGQSRNVITHAMLGDLDLVTPAGQLDAWNQTLTYYDLYRDEQTAMTVDALFWLPHGIVLAMLAFFVAALIKAILDLWVTRPRQP